MGKSSPVGRGKTCGHLKVDENTDLTRKAKKKKGGVWPRRKAKKSVWWTHRWNFTAAVRFNHKTFESLFFKRHRKVPGGSAKKSPSSIKGRGRKGERPAGEGHRENASGCQGPERGEAREKQRWKLEKKKAGDINVVAPFPWSKH